MPRKNPRGFTWQARPRPTVFSPQPSLLPTPYYLLPTNYSFMDPRKVIHNLENLGKEYRTQFAPPFEEVARMRSRFFSEIEKYKVENRIQEEQPTQAEESLRTIFAFPRLVIGVPAYAFAKRAGAVLVLAFLVFGGWSVTNASFQNITPGHPFYGFKIAKERAQLSFAVSDQAKARLSMSFAGNRLDEAASFIGASLPDRDARMSEAVKAFSEEVKSAKDRIGGLSREDAVSTARELDIKASTYHALLDKTGEGASAEVQEDVAVAKGAVDAISIAAIEVLIDAKDNSSMDTEFVRKAVVSKMNELEGVVQLAAVALSGLPDGSYPEVEALKGPTFTDLRNSLHDAREQLEEGKNFITRGGLKAALSQFREGFGTMNHVNWGIGLYKSVIVARENAPVPELKENIDVEIQSSEQEEGDFSLPILKE